MVRRASRMSFRAAGCLVVPAAMQAQVGPAEEIRALAHRPEIRRAFEAVDDLEPRTHADLITLTEIPAPPFMEHTRAARYRDMLADAGADSVWLDEVGNVIALRRGRVGARTVAIAGHLDTVFPEGTDVTVRVRGDTLFAPGIGDDTRGLIVVLTVLRALEAAQVETEADLLLIGTVGEEGLGDLRGAKYLFQPGRTKIDAWIAVDGGGLNRVVNGALGSHRYRITFRGAGGHSWGDFGFVNPHHALGRAILLFQEEADRFTNTGPRTSYNVGRVGGGTSVNAIPFESWMEVDMRSVSPERLERVDQLLQQAVARALRDENALRRDGDSLTVQVQRIGDRPSGIISESARLVQYASEATRYFEGNPEFVTASTDSNVPISLGVPAVTIGRGGAGDGAHSPGEWWLNEDGATAIKRALILLVAAAGVPGGMQP